MRPNHPESGALLLEILIVIAIASVVIAISSQLIYVSMQSNKTSGDKNVALGLLEEGLEGIRSAATERWPDLYDLTKGATNYYPQRSGGKWIITAGSENITINGITYTRTITVQNTCRNAGDITGLTDSSGSAITCTTNGGSLDPSTQRVSASVTWANAANSVASQEYVTRWRNKVCVQTGWSSGGGGTSTCPTTSYETKTNIDTTTGTSMELCAGC